MPKVFSMNIVYFSLGQGKGYAYHGTTVFKNMFNAADELKLSSAQKSKFGVDEVAGIFPEYYILRVNKFDDEVTTPFETMDFIFENGRNSRCFYGSGIERGA